MTKIWRMRDLYQALEERRGPRAPVDRYYSNDASHWHPYEDKPNAPATDSK